MGGHGPAGRARRDRSRLVLVRLVGVGFLGARLVGRLAGRLFLLGRLLRGLLRRLVALVGAPLVLLAFAGAFGLRDRLLRQLWCDGLELVLAHVVVHLAPAGIDRGLVGSAVQGVAVLD